MKLLRVTLLASALMLTASPRAVSTTTTIHATQKTTVTQTSGDCIWYNGVWLCN
jgi:hypothetical protein